MKKLWTGIVFIACFIFVSPVFAQTAFPQGGTDFVSAVTLAPGEYISTRAVPALEYEYYKLNITKGQVVKVKITTAKEGYANATLFNSEKEQIDNVFMIHENDSATSNTQIPYTGFVYLGIGDDTLPGNTYKISIESSLPTPTDEFGNPGDNGGTGGVDDPMTTSTPLFDDTASGSMRTPIIVGLALVIVVVIVLLVVRSKSTIPQNGKK